MSNEEREQYMKSVKWTTFFYVAFAAGSLLVGGAFGVATIRDDIKDNRTQSKFDYIKVNNKIDSSNMQSAAKFNDVINRLDKLEIQINERPLGNVRGNHANQGYSYQRIINGKLVTINIP